MHAPTDLPHLATSLGRSGERDERNVGMLHDRRPYRLADTVHELDHLGREPRLQHDLHQHGPRVGDVLGGLEDARVPAHQRREHLPRRDGHREVERRHDPGHADGAAIAHRPLVAKLAGDRVAEEAAPLDRGVIRRVDPLLYVAARLGQRLPHLAGHQVRDLLLARGEEVADATQHVAAKRCRRLAPEFEAALRRGDRLRHVLAPGKWEPSDDVGVVRRVDVLEVVTRRGGDPLSSDEVLEDRGHGERNEPSSDGE